MQQERSLKQDVLESLEKLPDDVDINEIMYRIYIVERLRRSLKITEGLRDPEHTDAWHSAG